MSERSFFGALKGIGKRILDELSDSRNDELAGDVIEIQSPSTDSPMNILDQQRLHNAIAQLGILPGGDPRRAELLELVRQLTSDSHDSS